MTRPSEPAPSRAGELLARIRAYRGPGVSLMEVCGTHTVAIARLGLKPLLPDGVRLLSGPGCPVCVTPTGLFDEALRLAGEGKLIATYGDALRVPGSHGTLAGARAAGARVHPVYSALDALELARTHPGDEVVFLGLGFETTSPTVAHAVKTAQKRGIANFSVLSAHKALMPAMLALLADPQMRIGAFLCPGHASMVLGSDAYRPIVENYKIPCVVAGFEPEDVLLGILGILRQAERGQAAVENAYPRAVTGRGNPAALAMLDEVFTLCDSQWRGLGELPGSGYELREAFAAHDARRRFLGGATAVGREPPGCRCADILRGRLEPMDCPLFATACTAENPVGACMVSSEGACGAHYRYRGV